MKKFEFTVPDDAAKTILGCIVDLVDDISITTVPGPDRASTATPYTGRGWSTSPAEGLETYDLTPPVKHLAPLEPPAFGGRKTHHNGKSCMEVVENYLNHRRWKARIVVLDYIEGLGWSRTAGHGALANLIRDGKIEQTLGPKGKCVRLRTDKDQDAVPNSD